MVSQVNIDVFKSLFRGREDLYAVRQIIISTGQYFGEGIDISALECLFIVYLFAFEGKLVQCCVQRSGKPPVIFDYRDSKIDYFEKMFKQRNRNYNKLRK